MIAAVHSAPSVSVLFQSFVLLHVICAIGGFGALVHRSFVLDLARRRGDAAAAGVLAVYGQISQVGEVLVYGVLLFGAGGGRGGAERYFFCETMGRCGDRRLHRHGRRPSRPRATGRTSLPQDHARAGPNARDGPAQAASSTCRAGPPVPPHRRGHGHLQPGPYRCALSHGLQTVGSSSFSGSALSKETSMRWSRRCWFWAARAVSERRSASVRGGWTIDLGQRCLARTTFSSAA